MGGRFGKWDIFADTSFDRHAANKRLVSNSYSMKTISDLEPFIQRPTETLLNRMSEFADSGKPMNLSLWTQWYAFDVTIPTLFYFEADLQFLGHWRSFFLEAIRFP